MAMSTACELCLCSRSRKSRLVPVCSHSSTVSTHPLAAGHSSALEATRVDRWNGDWGQRGQDDSVGSVADIHRQRDFIPNHYTLEATPDPPPFVSTYTGVNAVVGKSEARTSRTRVTI
ncbi:hypothetical protein BGW80DRAFT_1254217 [Lactifluus volemus]|nr:hypothetical protein BGW80DRAFT_1254217 [Lactifluus volemus]